MFGPPVRAFLGSIETFHQGTQQLSDTADGN
jgi:hypothetical protein